MADAPERGALAFRVFAAHVGARLAHRVDCWTLTAVASASVAGRAACAGAARRRARAVRLVAHRLAACAALRWLLRPGAALDDFARAALFDGATGAKRAEVKLARVMCARSDDEEDDEHGEWAAAAAHVVGPLRAAAWCRSTPVGIALWRCAPPDAAGTPRQAAAHELLSPRAAAAALASLYDAGFLPLRRRGWYNARAGEAPLWARP